MYCTCTAHVPHMYPTCTAHVPHMYPTCTPHVLHTISTCTPHTLHMHCTLYRSLLIRPTYGFCCTSLELSLREFCSNGPGSGRVTHEASLPILNTPTHTHTHTHTHRCFTVLLMVFIIGWYVKRKLEMRALIRVSGIVCLHACTNPSVY